MLAKLQSLILKLAWAQEYQMLLLLLFLVLLLPSSFVSSLQFKQGLPPCKACQAFSLVLLGGSRGDQGLY